MKDFYQILGVSRSASADEIKQAYRKLAKQHHPDLHKGDKANEDKFKEISEAYDVLSNQSKKQQYDHFGQWGPGGPGGGPGAGGQQYTWTSSSSAGPGAGGFGDFGDIFEDLFGMGGLGRKPGSGAGRSHRSQQGSQSQDLNYTMEISFEEAIQGTQATVSVRRHQRPEKISVKIPAGVKDGQKIRLAGKGEAGIMGDPGDLFITLKVKPHDYFKREGDDIYLELPITVDEAILGADIIIPTLSGDISLTIPPGTSSGQKLRLKGKGAPRHKKRGHGDQYVIPKIVLPKKIGENEKQLAEELAEKSSFKPRKGKFRDS